MAVCPKCNNFFLGAQCPYCLVNPKMQKEVAERNERVKRVEEFKSEWKDSFLCTTTPMLDGYKIERYCGTVTGSVVLGTGFLSEFLAGWGDFFGAESNAFSEKMETAKEAAMEKAISNALAREANAMIGVDIDYQVFAGNMVAAIVSGTAVFVKKIE